MEEFVRDFYTFDFAGHLAEDNGNKGKNEIDFDTVDIIEKDPIESKSKNDVGNSALDSDSIDKKCLSIVVISD